MHPLGGMDRQMEFIVNAWNALVQAISNALTSFGGVMRQFTYKDAIDILIVACIIYALIKLIRETRAAQLIKEAPESPDCSYQARTSYRSYAIYLRLILCSAGIDG